MKKIIVITSLAILNVTFSFAQNENGLIRNGNKLYKQYDFQKSLAEYKSALSLKPDNPVANYNLGNSQFRTNQLDEAIASYDATIKSPTEKPVREKAFYNKGVAFRKQQKLQESIEAWKNALKLDAYDIEARENLQKALLEQKKQQQENDKKNDKNDDKKDKKKEDQKQDKEKQEPEQPQPSKLNKKQVEQLLKALAQKEKEVQQKMQMNNNSPSKQEKDW